MEITGDMGPMGVNYQKMMDQMFQNKDADGNGGLSIEEMSMSEDIFAKIDTNEDGLADKDELKAFFPSAQFDRMGIDMSEKIAEKDANGDGLLSMDEVGGMPEQMFNKIDANGDGQLEEKELNDFVAKMKERAQQADGQSGKGKGKEEEDTTETVVAIDTDGDGITDLEEVTTLNANGQVVSVETRAANGGDLGI